LLVTFAIRSKLIKQLHSRLAAENVTINYPMPKLQFPEDFLPQFGTQPESQRSSGPQVAAG